MDPSKDETSDLTVKRVWAEGDYKNFQVKLGKLPFFSTETAGMLFDDQFSGAQVTFGKNLKATLEAGRWNLDSANKQSNLNHATGQMGDNAANYQGIGLNGTAGKLYGGAAYRHFNSNVFKQTTGFEKNTDEANIWSVGAGYTFDKNWNLYGAYAKNEKLRAMLRLTTSSSTTRALRRPTRVPGVLTRLTVTWVRTSPLLRRTRRSSAMASTTSRAGKSARSTFRSRMLRLPLTISTAVLDNNNDAELLFGRVNFWF